jgi:hypothetical protein
MSKPADAPGERVPAREVFLEVCAVNFWVPFSAMAPKHPLGFRNPRYAFSIALGSHQQFGSHAKPPLLKVYPCFPEEGGFEWAMGPKK